MTFSKEIIEIFDYIGEKFGIAIDWSSENVVPYLQELCSKYINYEIATSIMWAIVGAILISSSFFWYKLARHCLEKCKESGYDVDWDIGRCISWMALGVCVFIGIIILLCNVSDILKLVFFPELGIYEFVSNLIK